MQNEEDMRGIRILTLRSLALENNCEESGYEIVWTWIKILFDIALNENPFCFDSGYYLKNEKKILFHGVY